MIISMIYIYTYISNFNPLVKGCRHIICKLLHVVYSLDDQQRSFVLAGKHTCLVFHVEKFANQTQCGHIRWIHIKDAATHLSTPIVSRSSRTSSQIAARDDVTINALVWDARTLIDSIIWPQRELNTLNSITA